MMSRITLLLALALPLAGSSHDAGAPAAPLAPATGDLPRLEQALTAEPDSLRIANDYRRAVLRAGLYDRALELFARLVAAHPEAANAELGYGYVYVDEIPAAGSITQVILANHALEHFSRSIAIRRSWIALYTRGRSYLYWPKVFGRLPLAIADLEGAVEISQREPPRAYHAHAYLALGEAYLRSGDESRARALWREAARRFPADPQPPQLLALAGEALAAAVDRQLDSRQRVDTDLRELWEDR